VSNNTQISYKSQVVNIINIDGTFRVDSRLIAQRLSIQHRNFIENIRKYSSEFHQLGILPFQTEEINGRGQPEKYALLNEDQTIFALTLSRNTPEVVQLKLDLTVAFKNARQVATQSADKMVIYTNRELMEEVAETFKAYATICFRGKSFCGYLFAKTFASECIGVTGNQLTLAANNATIKHTGINPLESMGLTHLSADTQEQTLTISDIAKRLDIKPQQINPILTKIGLQTANRDHKDRLYYELTNLGKEHGFYLDTGKKHKTDGCPVRQIKWYDSAIELVKTHLEADFVLGAA